MGGNNANLLEEIRTTKKSLSLTSQAITNSHKTFTSHFTSFLTLAEQLEDKLTELELRERRVLKLEKEVDERTKQLSEKEKIFVDKEKNLEEREKKIEERERKAEKQICTSTREEMYNKLEKANGRDIPKNGEKFPKAIKLEVVFEHFIARIESQKQTTSCEVASTDRDPTYFQYVLYFILNGSLLPPSDINQCFAIEKEFKCFKIPFKFPISLLVPNITVKSLVSDNPYADKIRQWLPKKNFQLIYRASVDGFGAPDFHNKCDNKGPTLTLIRSSTNFLFGGYTPLSWDTSANYKFDPSMFIFTLFNPHNLPPTKFPLKPSNLHGIGCIPGFGPVFGFDNDIRVTHNSHLQNSTNYTGFSHSYVDITGYGNRTFTGAYNFYTNEIEVFSVIAQ